MERIAKSTGEIDKRTLNGNNGVSRGPCLEERKGPVGYYVLKEEVRALLRFRLLNLLAAFGKKETMARELKVSSQNINSWFKLGMISASGATKAYRHYKKTNIGFTALWLRPDLRFDAAGNATVKKCDRREMLKVVKSEEDKAMHAKRNGGELSDEEIAFLVMKNPDLKEHYAKQKWRQSRVVAQIAKNKAE